MLAALFVVAALAPDTTAGPCEVVGDPAPLRDVPEASGLAVSRRHPGLLWTHNDSGNASDLFAVDSKGMTRGRVRLSILTRDWEAIAIGSCPAGGSCLYVGDIGDNELARANIQVQRVTEPDPKSRTAGVGDGFKVTFPDGPHNTEAMFVVAGRMFFITRDRDGIVYGSREPLGEPHFDSRVTSITLARLGRLRLTGVTDAAASPDETTVAVRTSHEVVIFTAADLIGAPDQARPTRRIPIDGLREPQGEGVALGADGMLYLASEGRPWHRAGRFIALRCPTRLP